MLLVVVVVVISGGDSCACSTSFLRRLDEVNYCAVIVRCHREVVSQCKVTVDVVQKRIIKPSLRIGVVL